MPSRLEWAGHRAGFCEYRNFLPGAIFVGFEWITFNYDDDGILMSQNNLSFISVDSIEPVLVQHYSSPSQVECLVFAGKPACSIVI